MKSDIIRFVFAAAVIGGSGTLYAQDTLAVAAGAVAVSGFVDAFYSRNFANPASMKNQLRNFDISENQFTLSQAEIVLQKKAQPVGFRMDLDYGAANDAVQPAGTTSLSGVQQAYLTAVVPFGRGLTIDAGKFVTHLGSEVIESKDNWNYSRSLLFSWAIPYYHTGVRVSYPIGEELTACVHVLNGWNSGIDNNRFKTLGATLSWTPSSSTTVALNAIDGFEHLTPIENGKRTVIDLTVTQKAGDAAAFALNADYGQARTDPGLALWKGVALYGRYAVSSTMACALRAEIFDDPQGYATGTGIRRLDVKEFTGTYEYVFSNSLLLRGELRYDVSNAPVFDKSMPGSERSQTTALIGAVVLF